jgi:nucleotide-binding universal stress UspA family protein
MSTAEIRSILVATGLGADSDAPIRMAGLLAERAGAALHLLHALELQPATAGGVAGGGAAPDFQTLIERTGSELEDQARRASPPGLEPASREVVVFVPYKAILNRALQVSADLIVLGAHRRRPRGDQLLGPTPDRVIRSAAAPCLIVPNVEPRPFRRIVAPFDIEMPAAGALDLAQVWATRFGEHDHGATEIHALYIAPELAGGNGAGASARRAETALNREIDRSYQRVSRAPDVTIRPVIRHGGTPASAILRYVEEVEADLVVLGTRGFGAIRRALIGSVASTIARSAPCPILLVPPVLWRGGERG